MQVARIYDGVAQPAGPYFVTEHPKIDASAERDRIVSFLRSGELIMRTTGKDVDRVDASRGKAVPLSFRTDGSWVWSEALGYYLDTHGIAPEPDFLAYIAEHDYTAGAPTEAQRTEALEALRRA